MSTVPQKTIANTWAAELGRQVAERRAERQAEAEGGRQALSANELRERFGALAGVLLALLDGFAEAAGIPLEAGPTAPTLLELRATGGGDLLQVRLVDDAAVVHWRSVSRAETNHVDLAGDAFDAAASAKLIAELWIKQLIASEEAPHAR